MATYQELLAQKAAIDAQIEEALKAEVSEAVAEVKRLVGEYGLTASDCGFGAPAEKKASSKVAVKYRGQNGESWTGRGKAPAWSEYGLTAADCGFGAPEEKKEKTKVAVKYRGQNGEAWTGRGRAPAWIVAHESAGHSRESLLAH